MDIMKIMYKDTLKIADSIKLELRSCIVGHKKTQNDLKGICVSPDTQMGFDCGFKHHPKINLC